MKGYFDGDWAVENVDPWYEPLIRGEKRGRHMFWSNFHIPSVDIDPMNIQCDSDDLDNMEQEYGFDLSDYSLTRSERRKWLRNCVHPELGEHVFDAAVRNRQSTLLDI